MVSLSGTWIQNVAQQWLVLQLTHSAFKVGLIAAAQALPLLLLVLFTGPVADRANKRNLLLLTQIASLLLAALLGTLSLLHIVQFWQVLAIAGGLGIVNAFYVPTRQSFVPELVPSNALLNAVALNSTIFNGARVVGPALGGVLYAAAGPAFAFYVNAASYIAVIVGLLLIRPVRTKGTAAVREAGAYVRDLLEGFTYVFSHTQVMVILLLIGVTSLFAMNFNTLLPVFARFVLHESSTGFGALLAAQGAGSLIAAVVLSFWMKRSMARRFIYGGAFTFLGLEFALAFAHSYPVALAILLPIGFFMTVFTVTSNSTVLSLTPANLQGRVMSVYSLMFLGVTPIGSLLAGGLAQKYGAPSAFAVGSGISLVTTLAVYLWRLHSRTAQEVTALDVRPGE
jgi:MFS family permease